jgi:hypothetical protein
LGLTKHRGILRLCRWIASPIAGPAAAQRRPVKAERNSANSKGAAGEDCANLAIAI